MKTNHLIALLAIAGLLLAGCSGTTTTSSTTPSETTTHPNTPVAPPPPPPAPSTNPYPIPSSQTSITGSGATFPKPIIDAWAIGFNQEHSSVQVGYNGGGSGKGRADITAKLVQFAGSDAPMSATEKANAPGILHFPDTIGPVAVVYNVDGLPNGVHLTVDVVGQIFAGNIGKWDDNAIKTLNPDVASLLPSATIGIVYRSDSSGTTFAFTDALAKMSPAFANKVSPSASSKPDWTGKSTAYQVGGQAGNDGVGSTVKSTSNSIGYVDLAYVQKLSLKAATLQNSKGQWVGPTAEGASKAAEAAADSLPAPDGDWSAVSIVNSPADGAYPISSFSYILVYSSLASYGGKATADQLNGLKAWLYWDLHDGQVDYPQALGYAPLPAKVVAIGDRALSMITV
ncbi:MAG: phosphate ABC transporter substrate-binding protein PstS [bacterium]